MKTWHRTTHHFGWYTFDYCERAGCDDPTHVASENGPERDAALIASREREAQKAESRQVARLKGAIAHVKPFTKAYVAAAREYVEQEVSGGFDREPIDEIELVPPKCRKS